jgi:hypothetical protein
MTSHELPVYRATAGAAVPDYGLQPGNCYNADASMVIRRGPWPEGAHSDISRPEIAHLFWSAIQAAAYGKVPGITRPLS